jgi:hypothetical protein
MYSCKKSSYSLIRLLFSDPDGGGKSEGSVELDTGVYLTDADGNYITDADGNRIEVVE